LSNTRNQKMRIVEMVAVGVLALAAQLLVVGTALI
jgi:hypothetical protein